MPNNEGNVNLKKDILGTDNEKAILLEEHEFDDLDAKKISEPQTLEGFINEAYDERDLLLELLTRTLEEKEALKKENEILNKTVEDKIVFFNIDDLNQQLKNLISNYFHSRNDKNKNKLDMFLALIKKKYFYSENIEFSSKEAYYQSKQNYEKCKIIAEAANIAMQHARLEETKQNPEVINNAKKIASNMGIDADQNLEELLEKHNKILAKSLAAISSDQVLLEYEIIKSHNHANDISIAQLKMIETKRDKEEAEKKYHRLSKVDKETAKFNVFIFKSILFLKNPEIIVWAFDYLQSQGRILPTAENLPVNAVTQLIVNNAIDNNMHILFKECLVGFLYSLSLNIHDLNFESINVVVNGNKNRFDYIMIFHVSGNLYIYNPIDIKIKSNFLVLDVIKDLENNKKNILKKEGKLKNNNIYTKRLFLFSDESAAAAIEIISNSNSPKPYDEIFIQDPSSLLKRKFKSDFDKLIKNAKKYLNNYKTSEINLSSFSQKNDLLNIYFFQNSTSKII